MERNDLLLNYQELTELRDSFQTNNDKITIASYLVGEKYYDVKKPRLLVIGRALNGWLEEFNDHDAKGTLNLWEKHEKVGNAMDKRYIWDYASKSYITAPLSNCKGLEWVDTYIEKGKRKKKYKTANTPFWRAARTAVEQLYTFSKSTSNDFYKYIAWTNLFKACPQSGGNPQGDLWYNQTCVCNEILKQEIKILEPTHILVVAKTNTKDEKRENEWIAPFVQTLNDFEKQGIKVVCIHRPEFQKWEDIEKEIGELK